MQITIEATSSQLDDGDTVLIEVKTTIGDSVSTSRCGYSKFELENSRYMKGTLEERIEQLRVAAQSAAESSIKAQYAALLAYKAPAVVEDNVEVPVKKTRKARNAKPETEQE